MKTLTCDVCKRTIDNAITGRTYWHIGARDICEPCKDQLELTIKPIIRTKEPFNYEWYSRLMTDSIEKAIQKGRFDRR
ncbi:hypothetical protein [Breznakiella homolactica]|uniref:Uncharacterized protein n=1 Tax=Breznakiella homolactica TaxID=2798577 RepID=A0A7T8B962_9SPIR|nr:hypothetical protein [Breznakiella homolactica]QQO08016.1 hypothetical protein JFL75_13820 [Breznakiella homolactica]